MILLARYAHRKIKARRASRAPPPAEGSPPAAGPPPSPGSHPTAGSPPTEGPPAARVSPKEKKALLIQRIRLLAALAIPVYLETLDYTVVATAQPHIASSFHRLDLQSYIGTIYLLTSTVFLPLFASVADVFGRLGALETALVFFIIGSAISTAAQNMPMLLAGRGISGVGAAGMLTSVRVILADSSSLDDNNWQAGTLVALYTIGYCTGPVIGGALLQVSFRWIFAINLPSGVLAMILAFILLRNKTKGPQPPRLAPADNDVIASHPADAPLADKLARIDWIGAFLFCSGGVLLLLGLNWGSTDAWDTVRTIVCLALGVVLIALTLAWEGLLGRRQAVFRARVADGTCFSRLPRAFACDALIPLAVLKSYDACATSFAALTSGMVMIVAFYFVAIFMIIVTGLTAVQAGVQLIYFAPGMGGGTIVAIALIKRFRQPRIPIILGNLIIPIALGLISWAMQNNNQDQVNGFMVMAGVGVGMNFGPLTIHARFSQPESRVAIVVALQLFFRSLGGTIGLAQCSTVMNAKVRSYFNVLPANALEGIDPSSLSTSGISSVQSINDLPSAVQELVRNAFRNGVRWSFISLIPWCGVSFFLCLGLSKIRDMDREPAMSREDVLGVGESAGDESDRYEKEKVRGVSGSNRRLV